MDARWMEARCGAAALRSRGGGRLLVAFPSRSPGGTYAGCPVPTARRWVGQQWLTSAGGRRGWATSLPQSNGGKVPSTRWLSVTYSRPKGSTCCMFQGMLPYRWSLVERSRCLATLDGLPAGDQADARAPPDGRGGVGDGKSANGGNKRAAIKRRLEAYGALARVRKPIGTWLLLWPGWWAIGMAGPPLPEHLALLATFGMGAFLMRGAGCTVNDILDKDFDARVERTKSRPLASGVLTRNQAVAFLGVQLTAALGCLLTLNPLSIGVGAASLALVGTYPLMKRITYWPQAFLGLTFNYGTILGWTAATNGLDPLVVVPLYASGICWTLVYDTIYAHQDKRDDVLIGVKSTALLFGDRTKQWLSGFAACQVVGLLVAGTSAGLGWPYFASVALAGTHLAWQIGTVDIHRPDDCSRKFVSNAWLGAIVFAGIEVSQWLSS